MADPCRPPTAESERQVPPPAENLGLWRDSLKTRNQNSLVEAAHRLAIRCAVSTALLLVSFTVMHGPAQVVSLIVSDSREFAFVSAVVVLAQVAGLTFYRAIRLRFASVVQLTNLGIACEAAVFTGVWIGLISGVVFVLYLFAINLFEMFDWWDDTFLIAASLPLSIVAAHEFCQRIPKLAQTMTDAPRTPIQAGG